MEKRTDLAMEAREIWRESAGKTTKIDGVEATETEVNGFSVTTVRVLNENGAEALSKPIGTYVTMELGGLLRREEEAFSRAVETAAQILCKLTGLKQGDKVLVAGLGNAAITADAIGPKVARGTLVTWHLTDAMPETFGAFRKVSAIEAGVLGTTGIDSGDMIGAIVEKLCPDCVIAVDALASRSLKRLCSTIQITDTGIVPGSGVGNARHALDRSTLGVKVIAVGVPTVVDAATLAADLMEQAGVEPDEERMSSLSGGVIVTPKEIDARVDEISRMVAYAINMALQQIGIDDIAMLTS